MTPLEPSGLAQFARGYHFPAGKLKRVRLRHQGARGLDIDVVLQVRTAIRDLGVEPRVVRLRLRFLDVEEYRFQKRPGIAAGTLRDLHLGYFQGLFYVTFDSWSLEAGEQPGVHDFRGSDAFIASRAIEWEHIHKSKEA